MRQSQGQWQLQTAKAQLSAVVEAALRGNPQRITRRGKDAVMVLSEETYVALKNSAKKDAPDFVAHLLAIPRQARIARQTAQKRVPARVPIPEREPEFGGARTKLVLRDVDL